MSPYPNLDVPHLCLIFRRTPGILTGIAGPGKDLSFVLMNGMLMKCCIYRLFIQTTCQASHLWMTNHLSTFSSIILNGLKDSMMGLFGKIRNSQLSDISFPSYHSFYVWSTTCIFASEHCWWDSIFSPDMRSRLEILKLSCSWKCQRPGHLAEDCLVMTSNEVCNSLCSYTYWKNKSNLADFMIYDYNY